VWVPHDVRDQVVDFVRRWSEKTEIGTGRFNHWLGVRASKFYDWRERYGRVNEHNGWVPRDFWLEPWEKQAIIGFHQKNPLEGYRRLTFMMLDADVVAVSPSSVWRVLQRAGLLSRWQRKPSRKGTGFEQPPHPHQHWHIDISYINVSGTFYYLCSVLGVSRSGHINQSVKVRPRPEDSSLVAWEAPWSESKTAKPSDNILGKEYAQRTRLQRTVNADVASLLTETRWLRRSRTCESSKS